MTDNEIISACAVSKSNKCRVVDEYGCTYIIRHDGVGWTYCRDNSTGSIIPMPSLAAVLDEIKPVAFKPWKYNPDR